MKTKEIIDKANANISSLIFYEKTELEIYSLIMKNTLHLVLFSLFPERVSFDLYQKIYDEYQI